MHGRAELDGQGTFRVKITRSVHIDVIHVTRVTDYFSMVVWISVIQLHLFKATV